MISRCIDVSEETRASTVALSIASLFVSRSTRKKNCEIELKNLSLAVTSLGPGALRVSKPEMSWFMMKSRLPY